MQSEHDDEVRALVRQQANDCRNKLKCRAREVREADLSDARGRRANLDRNAERPPDDREWWRERRPAVLVGLTPTWTDEIVGFDPATPKPCGGCHGARLRSHEHCVVCSSQPSAPRRWPNLDPKERAVILAGPPPLRVKVEALTRRKRRHTIAPGRVGPLQAKSVAPVSLGLLAGST
jgi:hypothetical protein